MQEKTHHFSNIKEYKQSTKHLSQLQKFRQRAEMRITRNHKMGNKNSISVNASKNNESFVKYETLNEDLQSKLHHKTSSAFKFCPTYTQVLNNSRLVDNIFTKTIIFHQDIGNNSSFNTIASTQSTSIYRCKRLAPIKKQKSRESQVKPSNHSFLSVEKASILRQSDRSQNSDKAKLSATQSFIGRKGVVVAKSILAMENQEDGIVHPKQQQILKFKSHSVRQENIFLLRNKPFSIPFERYHYFDFIWKIAYSNNIKTQFSENLGKKYKMFIGYGNNSMLIKTLFKRREGWWAITPNIQEANFIWTQIKVKSVFQRQKQQQRIQVLQKEDIKQQKRCLAYKKNRKILNQFDTQNWMHYFAKYKENEQKLNQSFLKRSKLLKKKNQTIINVQKCKIHNHFAANFILGNKKALFSTMKKYYQLIGKDVFDYLPLTFHIQNGLQDSQYFKFLQYYYKKQKNNKNLNKNSSKKNRNIWIVKPGQFTNRGNGIIVCRTLEEVKAIVKNKKQFETGGMRTYIVQEYLDRPFLYHKRKFDIRHFMLITSINGHFKGYWYEQGYIRTTSYEYSVQNSFSSVHLTNDAVQKLLPDYGKYEKGNKVSYEDFEKYLQNQYGGKLSFFKQIYPEMKEIAHHSMKASMGLLDPQNKGHNFELFGFDFMIGSDFKPWLIEINTNPCLQLSCPLLMDIIPNMIENVLKIGVDSIYPPPYTFSEKRPRFSSNTLEQNKFDLIFDSTIEGDQVNKLMKKQPLQLNLKQLEKDPEEVFEDDGIELQD